MANWEFYDDDDEIEGIDEQEPSFSLYDFKKWLENQNHDIPSFTESIENKKREMVEGDKDVLKEQFKQRVRERVQRNIDKKLAERRKKRK